MTYLSRLSAHLLPAALLCSVAPLVVGCGSALSSTAVTVTSPPHTLSGGTITGNLHGGNQPIIGSTVNLYAVGTSGYGSAGTLLATTTSAGPNAVFSFTQNSGTGGATSPVSASYQCPAYGTQLCVTAKGGQTVGTSTNTAAAFVAAIGECGTASSLFVNMNEVTSVATMAALQQYFNPANETLGSPSNLLATTAFANGVNNIGNMINIATGVALTSRTQSAVPLGSTNTITVTVTPEMNQINTIADILASCVNSISANTTHGGGTLSSACSTLFADAVPPTAANTSQPSQSFATIGPSLTNGEDTLQALYFMLTNPASGGVATNMSGLFNLIAANGAPFQPNYSTSPTDWTIGIVYDGGAYGASAGICTPQTPSTSFGTASKASYLGGIQQIAVDGTGNLWMQSAGTNGDLYEMSSTGTPLVCTLGATLGASGALGGVAIDSNGYIWAVGSGTSVYKVNPATAAVDSIWPATAPSGNIKPKSIAADDNGNIFYTTLYTPPAPNTTEYGYVYEFAGGATNPSTVAAGTQVASQLATNILMLQTDASGNVWVPNQSSTTLALYEIYPSTGTGNLNGYSTYNIAGSTNGGSNIDDTYYIGIGPTYVNTTNIAGSSEYTVAYVTPNATPSSTTVTNSAQYAGGTFGTHGVAVDGAGNVWVPGSASDGNWVTGATTSLNPISEVSSTGASITAAGTKGGIQKQASFDTFAYRGAAIDPTGNVWMGGNSSSTSTSVYEIVGEAVPAVTPLSSTSLGSKP